MSTLELLAKIRPAWMHRVSHSLAHGGAIWVESEGHDEVKCPGATFHVLLPIRTEPSDPKLSKLFGLEAESKEKP